MVLSRGPRARAGHWLAKPVKVNPCRTPAMQHRATEKSSQDEMLDIKSKSQVSNVVEGSQYDGIISIQMFLMCRRNLLGNRRSEGGNLNSWNPTKLPRAFSAATTKHWLLGRVSGTVKIASESCQSRRDRGLVVPAEKPEVRTSHVRHA
jgi:hypothetical protein